MVRVKPQLDAIASCLEWSGDTISVTPPTLQADDELAPARTPAREVTTARFELDPSLPSAPRQER